MLCQVYCNFISFSIDCTVLCNLHINMLYVRCRAYRATLKNRAIYSECATLYKYVLNKKKVKNKKDSI